MLLRPLLAFLCNLLRTHSQLALEKLALRHQLAVFRRHVKRPQLRQSDRLLWVLLPKAWADWRASLVLVKPETVAGWHRKGFKLFWKRKSRTRQRGRPTVPREIINLIRRMAGENPLWTPERIQSELALMGHDVAEVTVAKYMGRRRPGSPAWMTFLRNHPASTAACDLFTVPTATFRVLYCFFILSYDRRRIAHFNVTEHPGSESAAQHVIEAFPGDKPMPKYLIRERDGKYGNFFCRRVRDMGICEVITSCIFGKSSSLTFTTTNESRPHLSLEKNASVPGKLDPPSQGRVVAIL